MALPTVSGTWDFTYINQQISTQATAMLMWKTLAYNIKVALAGLGWAVKGSKATNGTETPNPESSGDSWTSIGALSDKSSNNPLWICFSHPQLNSDVRLLMVWGAPGNSTYDTLGFQLSYSASHYSVGTSNSYYVPLPASEATQTTLNCNYNATYFHCVPVSWSMTTAVQLAYHVWGTTAASSPFSVIIAVYHNSTFKGGILINQPKDQVSGFSSLALLKNYGSNYSTAPFGFQADRLFTGYGASMAASTGLIYYHNSGVRRATGVTLGGSVDAASWQFLPDKWIAASDIGSNWPVFPIGLYGYETSYKGYHCTLQNVWVGSSNAPEATTYREGSTDLVQFQRLILPWNDSTPVIA